jgi:hypothetical protein
MSFELGPGARRATVACSGAGLCIAVLLWIWLGRAPQIGGDKDAIKAVDALFTAVTSRNESWLRDCEERLHALRDADRLSRSASDYLDGIIGTARTGNWRRAAKELFAFIRSQRSSNAVVAIE